MQGQGATPSAVPCLPVGGMDQHGNGEDEVGAGRGAGAGAGTVQLDAGLTGRDLSSNV